MLAILRTMKASPGFKPMVNVGHTRESAHANTMYCKQERIKQIRQNSPVYLNLTGDLIFVQSAHTFLLGRSEHKNQGQQSEIIHVQLKACIGKSLIVVALYFLRRDWMRHISGLFWKPMMPIWNFFYGNLLYSTHSSYGMTVPQLHAWYMANISGVLLYASPKGKRKNLWI